MISEQNAVRSFAGFVIGSGLLAMLALATQISALGVALAIDIFLWPPVVLSVAIYLRSARSGRKQRAPRRSSSSGRELSNALLGVLAVSVIMIVLLGSGLLAKPVVIGVVFAVGTVLSIIILMWLSALYVPTGLIWLRGAAGRRKDLYRGIRHTLRGELDKARDLLQRYEVQLPDDSRALYWQAMLFLLENEHPAALRLTQRALAIERRPETLVLRGQLMLRAGDKEQALADGEEAVDLNSRLPGVTDFVAAMLVTERRLDRAIELLEPARPAQRTAQSRFILAEAYRLRNQHDRARKHYQQAVKLAPFYVKFDLHGSEGLLACALAQLGRWDDADRHINSTLKRNPADALALYAEALCAKEDGDYGQLEATLKKMMPLNSGSHVVDALTDAQFTPLLAEKRFPELLAWALGAQRQARECVLARPNPPV